MKNNIRVKNIIPKCAADLLVPFALMYIFYIILHGHLSPGGGFQGGVMMAAVVVFMVLGYGCGMTKSILSMNLMHKAEAAASVFYVAVAMLGIAYLGSFCQNVFSSIGNIGELFSSGTVFLMDIAVGVKVLTGVGVLALSMFAFIAADDGKE